MSDLWAREMLSEGGARPVALASLSLCLYLNNPAVKVRLPFFALQLLQIHSTHINGNDEIFNNHKWLNLAAFCLDRLQSQVCRCVCVYICGRSATVRMNIPGKIFQQLSCEHEKWVGGSRHETGWLIYSWAWIYWEKKKTSIWNFKICPEKRKIIGYQRTKKCSKFCSDD